MNGKRVVTAALTLVLLACLAAIFGCGDGSPRRDSGKLDDRSTGRARLYLAGDHSLMVVNLRSRAIRSVKLPFFTGGDPPYRIHRLGHRLALWGRNLDPRSADAWATYSIGLSVRRPTSKLGDSAIFVPSGNRDRLWLISSGGPHRGATAQEITATGRATADPIPLPAHTYMYGSIDSGLVLGANGGTEIWNPDLRTVARRVPRSFPTPGATRGDLIANCSDPPGRLLIINGGSGSQTLFAAPPRFDGFECGYAESAFSPSGRMVAVVVKRVPQDQNPSVQRQPSHALAIIDLPRHEVQIVPDSGVAGGYNYVTWTSDGRSVIFTGGSSHREIVTYQLGDRCAKPLLLRLGDFYGIAAD